MNQIEAQGNKIVAACESLQNKEWEIYMSECEELNILMTTEEINKKMSKLSVLESKLPGILSRCGEEQYRQAKEMMDR